MERTRRFAHIAATGRCIPEKIVTNAELEEIVGEAFGARLVAESGIHERHVMAPGEATSDLIAAAAHQALQRAGLLPEELDLIIVATDTPDYISPATAAAVQSKLSAKNAGAFDVNSAGAGWVTALDMAGRYIATDPALKHLLVAAGCGMTKFMDWTDKSTCGLFGDGAACVVVGASDAPGHLAGRLTADGTYHDAMGIYTGGTYRPATADAVRERGMPHIEFARKFPPDAEREDMPALVRATAAKAGVKLDEIGLFLFSQRSMKSIEALMEALKQPLSKTHWIMDKWGDIGAAGIPAALDDVIENGRDPKPGEYVMFCAEGGGMAAACTAWRW